jgi:hypothetical protein
VKGSVLNVVNLRHKKWVIFWRAHGQTQEARHTVKTIALGARMTAFLPAMNMKIKP